MTNNEKALLEILKKNDGLLTRKEANKLNIPSSSFSRFVSKNNLYKVGPGMYAKDTYIVDKMFLLQKRYPKIIFSGMSALYLNYLTDRIPDYIEFTIFSGNRVRKTSIKEVMVVHIENNESYLGDGNIMIEDMFGNTLHCYGPEKAIVEMIRRKDDYDLEVYLKAIRKYLEEKRNDIGSLLNFAKKRKMEKRMGEILEIFINADK